MKKIFLALILLSTLIMPSGSLNANPDDEDSLELDKFIPFEFTEQVKSPDGRLVIEITDVKTIEEGLAVFVKAWRNGQQLGFGKDGTVEIERIKIINPPILVEQKGQLVEDPKAALSESLIHIVSTIGKKGDNIIFGKVGNTTTTVYPAAGVNSPVDGTISQDTSTNWSTSRNGTNGNFANNTAQVIEFRNWLGNGNGPSHYTIIRAFLLFDTSSIPDADMIHSANLSLYGSNTTVIQGSEQRIYVVSANPASNSMIVTTDFDNVGSSSFGETDNSWDTGGYNVINLNGNGTSSVSKDSITKFALRGYYDFNNVVPNNSSEFNLDFYAADYIGTTRDPVLIIEHEAPVQGQTFPRYTQIISPYPSIPETTEWADDVYANGTGQLGSYPCGLTVAQCGCALTSLVMSARNADITEDILGDDVNPGNMNAYLSDIDGYASGGALRWLAAQAYFGEFTSGGKIASRFSTPVQRPYGNVMSFIDNALTNPKNAVLAYKNGHFVWLPEKTLNTYTVRDPWWYNTMTANDSTADKVKDYNNVFEDARVLTIADEPVEFTGTDIEVHLQGTAELLFKKATGQKVGYDNGTVVVGLDKASYGNTEVIALGGAPLSGKGKHLVVYEAGTTFTLDVVGTGTGSYQLEFFTISATGAVTIFEFSGQTLPGLTTSFNFDLTSGQATEQPITYEQFLQIVNMQLAGATDQEKKFFLKWTEKVFSDLEKKTATQAIQSIQVYKKLLVAKKIQAPTLTAALDLLQVEVQSR